MTKISEGTCKRCKNKPVAPPRITKAGKVYASSRCVECLTYAANWQKNKTAQLRKKKRCISCGQSDKHTKVGAARCEVCTDLKAQNYFEVRAAS